MVQKPPEGKIRRAEFSRACIHLSHVWKCDKMK